MNQILNAQVVNAIQQKIPELTTIMHNGSWRDTEVGFAQAIEAILN
jgi:hypothetical protein